MAVMFAAFAAPALVQSCQQDSYYCQNDGNNSDRRYTFPDSSENQIMPAGREHEEYSGVGPQVTRTPNGSICVGAGC